MRNSFIITYIITFFYLSTSNALSVCTFLFFKEYKAQVRQSEENFTLLYNLAVSSANEVQSLVLDIATQTKGNFHFFGIKDKIRAMEKINVEYQGVSLKLRDLLRASIGFNNIEDLYSAFNYIYKTYNIVSFIDDFTIPVQSHLV